MAGSSDPITRGASTGVGNMKPVTLVATVVIKNSVVMPGMSLALKHTYGNDDAADNGNEADDHMQLRKRSD